MRVIDFLPVGDGQDSGDAIAMQFTRPDTGTKVVVTIDAGYEDDGEAMVRHVQQHYGTSTVNLAILTHPDRDHIGGMGKLVRGLTVERLWLHDLASHGGGSLPAADAVKDLIQVATQQGTAVEQPWAGSQLFGGALKILGPTQAYYEQLVGEQVEQRVAVPTGGRASLLEATRGVFSRMTTSLPVEVPFAAKEVTPRNNSSIVTLLEHEGDTFLFTGDAGVLALERAWDKAGALGLARPPHFAQIPHHGSRRNGSSVWLNRLLGPTGQPKERVAFVSAAAGSEKHPSARIVNAYQRRGYDVLVTAGEGKASGDWQGRPGWSPAEGIGPMDESDED